MLNNSQSSKKRINPGAFQAYNRPIEPNVNEVFGSDK